jgi:hypothetical protein
LQINLIQKVIIFLFLKDNDACLAMEKLMMTLKKKPELIGFLRRLTNIIKIIFDKKNAEISDDGSNTKSSPRKLNENRIPTSIFNLVIDLVEFYNSLYLINEFQEDLVPVVEKINDYFNKNFDRFKFKLFVGFYFRLFRDRSHNFRNCKCI